MFLQPQGKAHKLVRLNFARIRARSTCVKWFHYMVVGLLTAPLRIGGAFTAVF
jgi:hypothetical protein